METPNWLSRLAWSLAGADARAARDLRAPEGGHIQRKAAKPASWLKRRFDGAGTGRRLEDWKTNGASMNAEIAIGARLLKERARDLIRNDGNAIKAKREFQSAMVGNGIVPRSATGKRTLDAKINKLWSEHVGVMNARRGRKEVAVPGGYSIMYQAAGAWFESGEAGIRLRRRRPSDGLPLPYQIELLEADHIDAGYTQELAGGARVLQGVELDTIGGLDAYHLYKRHPGDSSAAINARVNGADPSASGLGRMGVTRVDARDFALCYEELRPGQLRGIPWLSPVIVNAKDLGDSADAERVRMRVAACAVAFVHGDEIDEEGIAAIVEDADGNPLEVLEPGLIAYVRGGKEIKFNQPVAVSGYGEFHRTEMTRIAAGVGMTYEQLSGDLSRVNFSSIRAGQLGFRRMITAYRTHMFVPMVCDPMWRWFVNSAIGQGILPPRPGGYPVRWVFPPWSEVDAVKHANAIDKQLRNGTLTYFDAVQAESGRDPIEVLDEQAEIKEACEERGITYDWAPWAGETPAALDPNADPNAVPGAEGDENADAECENCGETIEGTPKFCPGCGTEVDAADE